MHIAKQSLIALLLTFAAVAAPSAQQKYQMLGPNECLNCHDHDAEKQWYEKREIPEVQKLFPEKGANAGHINALKQLEAAKSNDFAKAIGLKDKYDLNGACVQCHATVFAGDANAGVSCESCHGPASGYNKPHQTKGTYDQSVAQYGMTRLIGNLQGWTQQCTNCHVMNDEKLIAAGHPSGDDFDLGKKYLPVSLHFKKMYAAADVSAIGAGEMQGILRRRRPGSQPAVAAAPAAAPVAATPAAAAQPPAVAPVPAPQVPPVSASAPPAAQPKAAPAPAPAPRAAAPPVAAAWSPTSIEPPPPVPGEAPAPVAPAAATTAPLTPAPVAAVTVPAGPSFLEANWPWLAGGIVVLVAGILLGSRKKRG